ncbi:MAG: Flp family type IVb pilin [Planctomycetaceae bacterium]|nr:Flp family type IVb pilin [Planctomycetaceae bacterium]
MRNLIHSIRRFFTSEDGPTAVEYAVMLALIVVVCLASVRLVGLRARNKFNAVKNYLTIVEPAGSHTVDLFG